MDRNSIYAGVSVVLAGLLGFTWADRHGALNADEARLAAGEIALVDMNKVFGAHKGLLARREDLTRDVERAQEDIKALVNSGRELERELKKHKKGTEEHDRLKKEVQDKAAEMKKLQAQAEKRLKEESAEMMLATYKSVMEEVQRIAENRGFKLVLQFSSEAIDTKNLNMTDINKVMQVINHQVLYQSGLDITDDVIQALN